MSKREREIVKQMVRIWRMTNIDWMGYVKDPKDIFSFHHLLVATRFGGPTEIWNGAPLCENTGHPYIHIIERYDKDLYKYLTKALTEINHQRHMPTEAQLRKIDEACKAFEREHASTTNRGVYIIQEPYTRRLVKKNEFYFFK